MEWHGEKSLALRKARLKLDLRALNHSYGEVGEGAITLLEDWVTLGHCKEDFDTEGAREFEGACLGWKTGAEPLGVQGLEGP